ncbi:MAG TPA: GTP-binding protein [Planctomycetota bacterium]|nr:GTP-binding protein [Planctomycetota bacterium]
MFNTTKKESLSIAIVGHVDHGKSTLIGRLLLDTKSLPADKLAEIEKISKDLGRETQIAYLTDQLKEEREKSITIDTTQIFFHTPHRNYVIIDTPGHVEFLKNMLSGTSHAQAIILIVDVHEGIQEQTIRHAHLVQMLGIHNIIILCNKMDLVEYKQEVFEKIQAELINICKKLQLSLHDMIPISAWNGDNVTTKSKNTPWYTGNTFLQALDSIPYKNTQQHTSPLRLAIQDLYNIENTNITVGKILQGSIKQKQIIKILPDNIETTVQEIKKYNEKPTQAFCDENIGLVLDKPTQRGQVLVEQNSTLQPTQTIQANIFWLSSQPWQIQETKILRCSTQETKVHIQKINTILDTKTLKSTNTPQTELQMNQTATLILQLDKPLVVEKFQHLPELGRFIIENKNNVQGFGIIQDIF